MRTFEGDNLVRVSLGNLIRLSEPASRLDLRHRVSRAPLGGGYRSPFKGRGMEFSEVRPYQPGDDIRSIDWRVTARSGRAHTKLFHEERERPVFIWVDYRRPMFFATRGVYKAVLAAQLGALLAWRAQQRNDRVGGLVFSESSHRELKPRLGKTGVLNLLETLAGHPAWAENATEAPSVQALPQALNRLRRLAHTGSLILLISDFRGLAKESESILAQLARHNQLALLQVFDPIEARLPQRGYLRFRDGDEERVIDSGDPASRASHRKRFDAHRDYLLKLARRHRMPLIPCRTDSDAVALLQDSLGTQ